MSEPTLPADPFGQTFNGDITLTNGTSAGSGTGSLYLSNGDLFVAGGSALTGSTWVGTSGTPVPFQIYGTTVTAGTNAGFNITDTASSGGGFSVTTSNNSGTNDIYLHATGISSQINVSSASTSSNAILITTTAAGNINLTSGSSIINTSSSTESTSFQVNSSGGVQINANDTFNGAVSVSANAQSPSAISYNANNGGIAFATLLGTGSSSPVTFGTTGGSGGIFFDTDDTTNGYKFGSNIGTAPFSSVGSTFSATQTGLITITTSDTTNGVKIANGTAGVPVLIGTSTSLTTIAGNLLVQGDRTIIGSTVQQETTNLLQLNATPSVMGQNSGVAIKRAQNVTNTITDVEANSLINRYSDGVSSAITYPITASGSNVPDASGTCPTGGSFSSTTIQLAANASTTNNYYNGWWLHITSGTGSGQVRRIKSYVGSTQIATIYDTSDNTTLSVDGITFTDGADFTTTPDDTSVYALFLSANVSTFWDETTAQYNTATEPMSDLLGPITQFQSADIATGSIVSNPKVFNFVSGSYSGGNTTFRLLNIDDIVSTGDTVVISNGAGFTGTINGTYTISSTGANQFVIATPSVSASSASASATVTILHTSVITAHRIITDEVYLNGTNLTSSFPSTSTVAVSFVANTSVTPTNITTGISNDGTHYYGSYRIIVQDQASTFGSAGACATFDISRANNSLAWEIYKSTSSVGANAERLAIVGSGTGSPQLTLSSIPTGGFSPFNYTVRVYAA